MNEKTEKRLTDMKGFGLFAIAPIKEVRCFSFILLFCLIFRKLQVFQGEFIGEYAGEIIGKEEIAR